MAGGDQDQRVAVGRRMGGELGGDRATGARPIVDDYLLSPSLRHRLAEQPRNQIDRAAGRKRHDQSHRPVRKALSRLHRCSAEERKDERENANHGFPP
jgi:hypothetical protein